MTRPASPVEPLPLPRGILRGILALFVAPSGAGACSMCSSALAHPTQAGMASGFYWSILFMLAVLFAVVSGLVLLFVREFRRESRLKDRSLPPPHP